MYRTRFQAEDFASKESFQEYISGTDKAEAQKWDRWIEKHPEYMDDFFLAKQLIRSLQFQAPDLGDKKETDRQRLQSRLFNDDKFKIHNHRSGKSVIIGFLYWKVAACLAFMMITGYLVWLGMENSWFYKQQESVEPIAIIEKHIPKGRKYTLKLEDGTIIKLNSESTLRYKKNFNREVHLSGEAFFDVAGNPKKPFTVHTGSVKITVVGTAFNLRSYQDENTVEVALFHGKVKVDAEEDTRIINEVLKPHQMFHIDENTSQFVIKGFNEKEIISWKDGILYFKNAGIEEIVKKLERWYDVKIKVEGNFKEIAFSGEFNNESLANVLNGLGFSLYFEYDLNGKEVIIRALSK